MSLKIPTVVTQPGSVTRQTIINGNKQSSNRSSNSMDVPVSFSAVKGSISSVIQSEYKNFGDYIVTAPCSNFNCSTGEFTSEAGSLYQVDFSVEGTNDLRASGGHVIINSCITVNDEIIHDTSMSVLAVANANQNTVSGSLILKLKVGDVLSLKAKQSTDRTGISARSSLTVIKI
jgi:hypothetical protein